jgi:peptidoglycan/LPS O-acetylase OafA/YrhL
MTLRLRYRPDIDGLRALAVIPVCLFHLGLPGCPGGFVGVDVFFVVSGYLMAALISQDLRRGDFSFASFYERRARRLLPALFAVLLFVAAAGSWLVTPKLFSDVGAMIAAAVLFASNFVLWRMSANYFNPATDWNPLVHTWSLGVEEQFYILFPVLLVLLRRLRPGARALLVIAVAMVSLSLSVWGTHNAPTAAFYLLPMRAWELLLGSLVALTEVPRANSMIRAAACGAGVILILIGVLLFNSEMPFPGAAALVPCVGAALVLAFGGEAGVVNQALSLPPLRFIGKISYSLYLWHWPLLVFVTRYTAYGSAPGLLLKCALFLTSIGIAYVSWRWIEQPFRHGQRAAAPAVSRRALVWATSAAAVACVAFGSFAISSAGWSGRFPGYATISMERQLAAEAADIPWETYDQQHHDHCFSVRAVDWRAAPCYLTRGGSANVLLWGDSFAAAYAPGFFNRSQLLLNVVQYTSPSCPPIVGYSAASKPECKAFDARIAQIVRSNAIDTVVMAANWSVYLQRRKIALSDIAHTAAYLKALHVKVILVGQSPVFPFPYPDAYFYQTFGTVQAAADYYAPSEADPNLNQQLAASASADIDAFFDPSAVLCRRRECVFRRDNQYLFLDFGHFSRYGSGIAVTALLNATRLSVVAAAH